jgi:hypothetical protein
MRNTAVKTAAATGTARRQIPGKAPQDPQQKGRNEGQEQPVVAGPLGEDCQRQRCRHDRKVQALE